MAKPSRVYRRCFDLASPRPMQKKGVLEALEAIWREHRTRLSGAFALNQKFGVSKNEDAKNFLRREVYVLGLALRRRPPRWNVSEFISSIRAHPTTRITALEGQIFQALLMGVYEEDSTISRQERWVMSRELEYAFAHGVPPEFLCGFLYQSGGRKNLLEKLESGFAEPAFRAELAEDGQRL